MSKVLLAAAFLLALALPAQALPLPGRAGGIFTGEFNGQRVFGNIEFVLDRQLEHPTQHVSNVIWGFRGSAVNLPFEVAGQYFNDFWLVAGEYDPETTSWDARFWEVIVDIREETSGSVKRWFGAQESPTSGPPWNLLTNENFLPSFLSLGLSDGETAVGGSLALAFDISPSQAHPVPEPGTLLLAGAGLLAILRHLRKRLSGLTG